MIRGQGSPLLLVRDYRVRYTENNQEYVSNEADCVRCSQERMAELGKREGVTDVRASRVDSGKWGWCGKH